MGGTDTQVENLSHRWHQTRATITGHVVHCLCLGFVLFLGTDTQVENPSHRLHQTEATTTGHVMNNCFCLGCLVSRVTQQVLIVDVSCVKIHTWYGVI